MAKIELGTVSWSQDVEVALAGAGIAKKTLLDEHRTTPHDVDDSCWVTSSFNFSGIGRTIWAITDTKHESTALMFQGK